MDNVKKKENEFYQKLLKAAFIIHCYSIGDEFYFYLRFSRIEKSVLQEIWKVASSRQPFVTHYELIDESEKTIVRKKAWTFRGDSKVIYDYLSKPLQDNSKGFSVECELRRVLAIRYIDSVGYSLYNGPGGIPKSFLSALIKRKQKIANGVMLGLLIFGVVALFSLPRIIDGFTPVRTLAREYYEDSRYKFSGAICRDGWISHSRGRGTCSHHGGVREYFDEGEHRQTYEECLRRARERSWVGE